MSWIQQNKFVAALAAITLVLCAGLLYLGSKGGSRYEDFLNQFRKAEAQVNTFERLQLYPNQANLDGKTKAIADYEASIDNLKSAFQSFRKPAPERISPQEFSDRLVATHDQIAARLRAANVELPAGFYSGFEAYTTGLAQGGATPVLSRQLEIAERIFNELAEASPEALINLVRVRQPEEQGNAYQPGANATARPFSFEITFKGTESSARKFISSLGDTSDRFAVIRTLRIRNESTSPPQASSAQFTTPAASTTPASPFDGGFFGAFDAFVDDDDDETAEPGDLEDGESPAPPAPAPSPQTGGARMLSQVAGSERIVVFIRFDVMDFLAAPGGNADES